MMISSDVNNIVNIINNNTGIDDKISVYGNNNIFYVLSGREHATKYSYQYPIGKFYPKIVEEYFNELSKEKPKIIIVEMRTKDSLIQQFLKDNNYLILYSDSKIGEVYRLLED